MNRNYSLNNLPAETKLNIFSRLPVESVLDCKLVCKSWNYLLNFTKNTYFANMHLQYHQHRYGLTQQQLNPSIDDRNADLDVSHDASDFSTVNLIFLEKGKFSYGEYYLYRDYPRYNTIKVLDFDFPVNVAGIVGSCNGLICLSVKMKCENPFKSLVNFEYFTGRGDEPLYVCNPVTRELVTLEPLCINNNNKENQIGLVHGFGYHPSTDEYKVVTIWYCSAENKPILPGRVEVYSLGKDSGWRDVGEVGYFIVPSDENGNICANGSLHWLKYETREIVAFDLADEEFHFVHTPPGLSSDSSIVWSSRIFVMRGCLCLACEYEKGADLWILKRSEKKISGSCNPFNAKDHYYKCRSWSKELRLGILGVNRKFKISGLTKEGKVILRFDLGLLTQYNLISTVTTAIHNNNGRCLGPEQVISHVNSFVSLKALGEDTVKI